MTAHSSKKNTSKNQKKRITRKGFSKLIRIFRFILPYKYTYLIGCLFLAGSTGTALLTPLLLGQFLDVSTGKTSDFFSSIDTVAIIFAIVLVAQATFSFFRVLLFVRVSENAMKDMRISAYSKIISLSVAFFEKKRVGELTSRLTSDIGQLQEVMSFTFAEFFRQIGTLVIGVGFLFYFSTRLAVLMILTFPVLVFAAIFFGRFIRKLSKKAQDELANANTVVEETFQSIRAVKAFTNEAFEVKRYDQALHKVVKNAMKAGAYRAGFNAFVILALFGGIILVVWYGAHLVDQNLMSVGDLTSFAFYTVFIGSALGGLSNLYGQIQRAVGSSERILEILEEETEINLPQLTTQTNAPTLNIQGNISFKDVHFSYPTRSDVTVLKQINFEVKAGQKVALVGYSGGGKSTIVQLLFRYYDATQGTILIDGKNVDTYDISALRQHIGIVPQEVILFGGTIKENILYGRPDANDEEVRKAAEQANAWRFIEGFPDQLETIVGERGVKLSGGQRQRIAIARAILKNPEILVLDEATSSLDADSEHLVQEALNELMQNRTTIIIAHRLSTIRSVDTIYVLSEGNIVEAGSHDELVNHENGVYNNLVKLQFEASNGVS
ncbi:ABC transporter transmembrane domain-containing protein [uncultured Microscilla sp.]|uniref:ABC transporter ATP-binding protein n=1 Tax=uncultured Microscilla sp. TaxID=432653 RepID=UPI0026092D99|nr:ABC transporter transmembrane domain-containing protein [uncultured Microscilla sp.]